MTDGKSIDISCVPVIGIWSCVPLDLKDFLHALWKTPAAKGSRLDSSLQSTQQPCERLIFPTEAQTRDQARGEQFI